MNWCMLLVAASVACPWSRNTTRTYYWCEPTPVYVQCQPAPPCTYPSTMVVGPVVAEVVEETQVTSNVKAEEKVDDPAANEEESVTEFASLSEPTPYAGGDMALDWGVASIGAGTLYPTPPYSSGGAGLFGLPRGSGSSSGDFFSQSYPTIINNNIINNNNGGNPGPNPVPEPGSVAIWSTILAAVGYGMTRRRRQIRRQGA